MIFIAIGIFTLFIGIAIQPCIIAINLKSKSTELISYKYDNEISNGLAPRSKLPLEAFDAKNAIKLGESPIGRGKIMYGYNAYPGPEGTVYFDTETPETVEECDKTISGDFLAGGTFGCDDVWYACQYGSGLLYGIDPYNDCEMWVIGGGGQNMNGLAYNPINNKMYGSSDDNYLYEIDSDTGEQEQIGPFGHGVIYMIGMAFDYEGILYGWDLGNDKLWTIDTETGEATEIGPLGININYAQDGDFHRESDTLYLTAYTTTGQLGTVNKETGTFELIGNFEGGMEITASIFENSCELIEHDISLVCIDSPQTGRAEPDMNMTITVKNVGNKTETFDAQMEIIKCESGPLIMEEYFDAGIPADWETDYWETSYTVYAGGQSPEARCSKYTQYYQVDYYDNSIQTPPIDCSDAEKVNLRFRWAGDYYYSQYAHVYVKFRRNSTSQWKDVTPWGNPVGENQDGELYEIGCYDFGEPIGEEFQVRWEYIGYYYYFNNLYLDDVTLELCGSCPEYAELVEDITLDKEEEIQVSFPGWTPSEWQNESAENTWEEYPVHAFIICEGDENPRNDEKWIFIDLWYPWMHDVEVMKIDSPQGLGDPLPGQTFPVQATIRNVGQYAECCIPIDIKIGESMDLDALLTEDFSNGQCPPSGWTDEHNNISHNYGWRISNSSYSGGTYPEAYIPYKYAKQGYVFYTYAIDTLLYSMLRLRFKTYINHYSGQGSYALEAGYSKDGENWYSAWHEEPDSCGKYEVDVPIEGGSENLYIGFWVKGNPYYFNYWFIDDVELIAMDFTEEYYDLAYHEFNIEPGEEVTFTFEDWTPYFLVEEITGLMDYIIEATIEMDIDKNPDNDVKKEKLTLDYWYDVGIDELKSPTDNFTGNGDVILFDNGKPDGRNGLAGSMYLGYNNILIDDFQNEKDWTIHGGRLYFIWNSGYLAGNLENIRVYLYKDQDDCEPSLDEYPEPYYIFEAAEFTEYTSGNYYFGRPEIIVDFILKEEASIKPGKWYVGIQPEGLSEDIAYLLTSENKGCEIMVDLPFWGYQRWTAGSTIWGDYYDVCWELHGNKSGPPSPNVWIQPGTENIDVTVMNYGTFPKEDLTCYADIWEYITDPENGTQIYSDEISNIDLTTPLGGSRELNFSDFTFVDEGRYGLILNLPADPDDIDKNNKVSYGIAVDDTKPECDYPPILEPLEPDGENGWYVSDVTVTLNATDPWSNGISSGVKEIRYTVNGGAQKVLTGSTGSFALTEDGNDILVEYWAVDYVGNVETPKNSFTVDIDQTRPCISLSYEVSGDWWEGWIFTFTATATDDMSGIERVEFYINDIIQETVYENGPEYSWDFHCPGSIRVRGIICNSEITDEYVSFYAIMVLITSFGLPPTYFIPKACAFDFAGNQNFDEIEEPCMVADTIYPGLYLFRNLTLPNNYTGHIGKFFILASFSRN